MSNKSPGFLTIDQYEEIVNPKGEHHSSSAYQETIETMNSYNTAEKFSVLINQFIVNGIEFELKAEKYDRWSDNFVKHDAEGNVLYGEDGKALYKSLVEKAAMFPERYRYEHAIIEKKSGKIIANTQDEWGCLLLKVAAEYRCFGLGQRLYEAHRGMYPYRHSGGFTPNGQSAFRRYHQSLVSKHLANGDYSKSVRNGEMRMDQVKTILKSSDVVKKYVNEKNQGIRDRGYNYSVDRYRKPHSFPQVDLGMRDSSKWSVHVDSNWAIIYDQSIFNLLEDKNAERYENFIENAIQGYVYVGAVYNTDSTPKLHRDYARDDNPKIKGYLGELMLNADVGSRIRILEDQKEFLEARLGDALQLKKIPRSPFYEAWINEPTIDPNMIGQMNFVEKAIRLQNDEYDEKWVQIQEMASSIAESDFKSKLNPEEYESVMSL